MSKYAIIPDPRIAPTPMSANDVDVDKDFEWTALNVAMQLIAISGIEPPSAMKVAPPTSSGIFQWSHNVSIELHKCSAENANPANATKNTITSNPIPTGCPSMAEKQRSEVNWSQEQVTFTIEM